MGDFEHFKALLIGRFQPGRARACGYAVTIVLLSACTSPYYNVMERLGVPKRDILVDRVEAARDSQEQAAEQFKALGACVQTTL